jgi:YD repeat-containing protein
MAGSKTGHVERTDKAGETAKETESRLCSEALDDMRTASQLRDRNATAGRDTGSIHFRENGDVVHSEADGRVTRVQRLNGTEFDYKYDRNGQLKEATITGPDGEKGTWVKAWNGEWRAYDNKGRHTLVLRGGDWEIIDRESGRMGHQSGQVQPVAEPPRKRP